MQGCPLVSKLTSRAGLSTQKVVVLLDVEVITILENARGHPSTLRELTY